MSLIQDYFSITGRPIATMTVAEYLEFCRYEQKPADRTEVPAPIKPAIKNEMTSHEEAHHENTKQTVGRVSPIQKQETKEQTADILSMLQSVSG